MKRLAIVVLLLAACSKPPAASSTSQHVPVSQLPSVDPEAILAHTKVLSSDAFEGRGPGTKGEDLTVDYLVEQFKKIGLKPGNTDGSYVQKVPLVGITPAAAPLVFEKGGRRQTLQWKDDVVAWTKHVADSASINHSQLVFVGYGIVAPEYNWDDYKGLDVKGKTLVMLVNDPPVADAGNPSELDPKVFGGKAMTYYGRWTYKYEIAAQKGAAGVLIVHETVPAGYPFEVVQAKTTEQFDLVTPDKNLGRVNVEGWITLDRARALMQMAGQDFEALKKQAASRDFTPVPLGVTASMTIRNTLRTIDSRNVIARLDGSDPALRDEYVIYTAHWDHLGVGPEVNGDRIYNGAKDNAIGTAGLLELARAFTKVSPAPKRSILFLSVTAEEQGLLGSQYYSVTPIYPLRKTLANINMDGLNVHGPTKDLTLIGYGASDLDDYAKAAAEEQGRVIRPDPETEKGFYYRSDHFNFAKQGVPALDPDEGVEFVGKPAEYGKQIRDDYTEHDYHKPSDVIRADWDLAGAVQDLQVFFAVGYRVAQADKFPAWKPGNEFKAIREEMLKNGV
jgi:Zn-dependent M28 family amino/carboxypeptidase